MNRDELRAINLQRVVAMHKTIAAVAAKADTAASYLSAVIRRQKSKAGHPRVLGNDVADRIEDSCDLWRGWLDIDHDNPPQSLGDLSPAERELIALWRQADDRAKAAAMAILKI